MITPTPRTDADCFILPDMELVVSADFARTLERELSESRNAERLARVQLGAERGKVRVLRETMKIIANDENYMELYFDPCQLASSALAATEDKA